MLLLPYFVRIDKFYKNFRWIWELIHTTTSENELKQFCMIYFRVEAFNGYMFSVAVQYIIFPKLQDSTETVNSIPECHCEVLQLTISNESHYWEYNIFLKIKPISYNPRTMAWIVSIAISGWLIDSYHKKQSPSPIAEIKSFFQKSLTEFILKHFSHKNE